MSLKPLPTTTPRVAEMSWQPFDAGSVAACRQHGDAAVLRADVPRSQLDAAKLLAADVSVAEAAVEVRAVLSTAAPYAPAGHCLRTEQLDVTAVLRQALRGPASAPATEEENTLGERLSSAPSAGGGRTLLVARVRQNGNVVIKAWATRHVSQFYATRSNTETKNFVGARHSATVAPRMVAHYSCNSVSSIAHVQSKK